MIESYLDDDPDTEGLGEMDLVDLRSGCTWYASESTEKRLLFVLTLLLLS